MRKSRPIGFVVAAIVCTAGLTRAALLVEERFDYAPGSNVSTWTGGTGLAGAWSQALLAGSDGSTVHHDLVAAPVFPGLDTGAHGIMVGQHSWGRSGIRRATSVGPAGLDDPIWLSFAYTARQPSPDGAVSSSMVAQWASRAGSTQDEFYQWRLGVFAKDHVDNHAGVGTIGVDYQATQRVGGLMAEGQTYLILTRMLGSNEPTRETVTFDQYVIDAATFAAVQAAAGPGGAIDTALLDAQVAPAYRQHFVQTGVDVTWQAGDEIVVYGTNFHPDRTGVIGAVRYGTGSDATAAGVLVPIPEPAGLALLALGGLALRRRRR